MDNQTWVIDLIKASTPAIIATFSVLIVPLFTYLKDKNEKDFKLKTTDKKLSFTAKKMEYDRLVSKTEKAEHEDKDNYKGLGELIGTYCGYAEGSEARDILYPIIEEYINKIQFTCKQEAEAILADDDIISGLKHHTVNKLKKMVLHLRSNIENNPLSLSKHMMTSIEHMSILSSARQEHLENRLKQLFSEHLK